MSLSLSCLNQVCVPYCESALLATTYTCPLKCLGPLFGLPTQKKLALKLYKTYTGTRISEQKNNVLSCTTVRDILTDLWIIILIFGTYLLVCENNTLSVQGGSSSEHQPLLKRWTLDNVITLTLDDSRNIGDDSRNILDDSRTCANHTLRESSVSHWLRLSITSFHLGSLRLHFSASAPIMFVADSGWLLTRTRQTHMGLELLLVACQALPFH